MALTNLLKTSSDGVPLTSSEVPFNKVKAPAQLAQADGETVTLLTHTYMDGGIVLR